MSLASRCRQPSPGSETDDRSRGVSAPFSVVAIVAAYNEADIVGQVVADLIQQGIDVYFLDDGSTDGTVAEVDPYVGRGVLAIERLRPAPAAADAGPAPFAWERILRRKAELAASLDAHWFIHHDADEFRESPWPGESLKDAIRRVDALGYNAIDFTSLDFRPVCDGFRPGDDVRRAFQYYQRHDHDRLQIRCWKRSAAQLDLASSGGHEAVFAGRRVFPERFILRHYPIRSQAHGERKVFEERQRRYLAAERARGWHVQYDAAKPGDSFIADASTLTRYDPLAVRVEVALRHRGVEELEERVAAARAETAAVAHELAESRRARAELAGALAHATDEYRRAQAALGEAAAYCATLQSALTGAQAADVEARAHMTTLTSELAAHREALGRRMAEIEQWRQLLEAATRQLQEVHGSLSWRLLAPARALIRLFRGR